jgi:hypothetical protein
LSDAFRPTFNRAVKVRNKDERITSDAGVLLLREAGRLPGITADLAASLYDSRKQEKTRYRLMEVFRERIDAMAMG